MATRIVLLGWAGRAMELAPNDAAALVDTGTCRVSMTKWGGPLADATVLEFRVDYLLRIGAQDAEATHDQAWANVRALIPSGELFQVDTPIPVGA